MRKTIAILSVVLSLAVLVSCNQDDGFEERYSMMYEHLVHMWAQSVEPYSCDIAFYGDSRVSGANWREAFEGYDIVNLGVGGDKVEEGLTRLPLVDSFDVKCVFLAIGGNNAAQDPFNREAFSENYGKLLDGLSELGAKTVVCTVAGVVRAPGFDKKKADLMNRNIATINEIIKLQAEARELEIVDMAALMNDSDGCLKSNYTTDGIHFNTEGNNVWFDALRPYVEKAGTI